MRVKIENALSPRPKVTTQKFINFSMVTDLSSAISAIAMLSFKKRHYFSDASECQYPFIAANCFSTFNYNGFPAGVILGNFHELGPLFNYGIMLHFPFAKLRDRICPSFRTVPELNWNMVARHGLLVANDIRQQINGCDFGSSFLRLISHLRHGYIYLHVDKFYIPGSPWFLCKHVQHDVLLLGIDIKSNTVCIMAGFDKKGHYRPVKISILWLILAVASQKGWARFTKYHHVEMGYSQRFREPVFSLNVSDIYKMPMPDFDIITESLAEFYYCKCSWNAADYGSWHPIYVTTKENGSYGLDTYNCVKEYILRWIGRKEFDFRVTRLLWEHKKLMTVRFSLLKKCGVSVSDYSIETYKKLERFAYQLHLECYGVSLRKRNVIERDDIIKRIDSMYVDERSALESFLSLNA